MSDVFNPASHAQSTGSGTDWTTILERKGGEAQKSNEKAATFKGTNCIAVLKKKLEKWSK